MTDRLRRLDALFAERVLGCRVGDDRGDPTCDCAEWAHGLSDTSGVQPWDHYRQLAPYTRSLDAAWEGATVRFHSLRVGHNTDRSVIIDGAKGPLCCAELFEFGVPGASRTAFADHPAEALVLACLRAVGVDESELG